MREFFWQFGNIILIGFIIVLAIFLTSLFFKKSKTQIAITAALFIGIFFIVDQMKYSTFTKLYSDELDEDTIVESVTISINDISNDIVAQQTTTKIEDQKVINRILEDFSTMELKRDNDVRPVFRDYSIEMVVTNEIKERNFLPASLELV